VVNFDLPQAPDDFVHRVGRTGRAGQRGAASTFVSKSERGEVRRIERECHVRLVRRDVLLTALVHLAEQQKRNEATVPAFKAKSSGFRHKSHFGKHSGSSSEKPSGKQRPARSR
jgi:ATP-dependent RNA helicase RhlE